jgi:hypothetical protein
VRASITLVPSLLITLAAPASGQVFVRALEDGQGLLRDRNGTCFVITPQHVIVDAYDVEVVTEGRLRADATVETEYPGDIALLRVAGPSSLPCPPFWDNPPDLSERLASMEEATVVSRNPDGSLHRRFVRIVGVDETSILLRPMAEGDALFKGLSGSLVLVDGRPAGMLQEVETEMGDGRAVRLDQLSNVVRSFFDVDAPEVLPTAEGFTVEAVEFRGLVSDETRLMSAPDRLATSLARLTVGTTLTVTGRVAERLWYRVRLRDGTSGFVPISAVQRL